MADLIDRQAAIDIIMEEPSEVCYPFFYAEKIKQLPPAQLETDGLDAVRHARQILWDKCKKYLAEHTDEACPILYGEYQEEYTCMTNEVKAMSRAIYIMEGMKNRGEISVLPSTQPELRWIPVEDEPPKKFNRYWVCTDTGYQCECRWTNNIYGLWESDEWGWSIFDIPQYAKVVAYMPLPKPYERSEDAEEVD